MNNDYNEKNLFKNVKSRKLRIVFAYCNNDPWIALNSGDLYRATQRLGYELFVIGAGENNFIHCNNYVNLDYLKCNSHVPNSFLSKKNKDMNLEKIVDLNYVFLKRMYDKKEIVKVDVQQKVNQWSAEARIIFKTIQPDLVISWNGLLYKRAVYAEAAKFLNIPVFYAENGMLPNSWYIDPKGINAQSTIAGLKYFNVNRGAIEKWKLKLEKHNNKGRSSWEQPKRKEILKLKKDLGIKNDQKIIFFPGQVNYDSNIILFSPHFSNTLNALAWLVKGLPKDEFFVLAKPHPKGKLTLNDFEKAIEDKGIALSKINVLDAIELSDCVVSINSTVAFEAAIRDTPVLLLGNGVLSNKDFVSNYVPGIDAYTQVVQCIDTYNKNRSNVSYAATSMATYLDLEYYAHRGEYKKLLKILKRLTENLNIRVDKTFTRQELAVFFQMSNVANMANQLSGKVLMKALLFKIKNKILTKIGVKFGK